MAGGELLVPGSEVSKDNIKQIVDESGNIYSFGFRRPPKKTDKELEEFLSHCKGEDISYQKSEEAAPLDLLYRDMYIKEHFVNSNVNLNKVTKGMLGSNMALGFFSVMEEDLPLFQFYSQCYPNELGELYHVVNKYLESFSDSVKIFNEYQGMYMKDSYEFDSMITLVARDAGRFINLFKKIYGNLNYEGINLEEKESLSALEIFLFYMKKVADWTVDLIGYKYYRKQQASYRNSYTPKPKPEPQPSSGGGCVIL